MSNPPTPLSKISILRWFTWMLSAADLDGVLKYISRYKNAALAWAAIEAMVAQDEEPLPQYQGTYQNPKQPE